MHTLQKTGGRTKAVIVMMLFLISTLSFSVLAVVGPPDDINVMLTTDWQNAGTPHADMNANCDIDLLFNIGDIVNDPTVQAEWDTFHTNWDAVTGTGTILYRNYTHGNHESYFCGRPCNPPGSGWDCSLDWMNRSRLCPTYESWMGDFYTYLNTTKVGNYTYTYGNVLFIIMGIDYRDCMPPGVPVDDDVYSAECWLDWCNETIQANQDMNIIILEHLGIETGSQTYYLGLWEQDEYYWIMQNYNVFAWIHGHTHLAPSVTELHGTYHLNAGKATSDSETSVLFYFTNGSSTVNIRQRNHGAGTWTETISGYNTLTLDFAFDSRYEEDNPEIEFISIDGDTNGTTIYSSTPTFNWTIVADTIQYQLQIATDSAFTSLVVNLTDINEANYPTEHDANATRVSFTLPNANSLPSYDVYYCRVRAKRL